MAPASSRTRTPGNIFIISAPSGSGKTTLVKRLLASVPGLSFSVSHTTRAPRPGEREGREYFFITPAKFRRMVARDEFLEWAQVFGNYYGTTRDQVCAAQRDGRDVLLDIDVQGHRQVKQRLADAVSIFLLPPSYKELKRRLRKRHSEAPDVIRKRLVFARGEVCHWPEYDYLIVNDRLAEAARALRAVVIAAHFRKSSQMTQAQEIAKNFGG